jgi:hypothetical protein
MRPSSPKSALHMVDHPCERLAYLCAWRFSSCRRVCAGFASGFGPRRFCGFGSGGRLGFLDAPPRSLKKDIPNMDGLLRTVGGVFAAGWSVGRCAQESVHTQPQKRGKAMRTSDNTHTHHSREVRPKPQRDPLAAIRGRHWQPSMQEPLQADHRREMQVL